MLHKISRGSVKIKEYNFKIGVVIGFKVEEGWEEIKGGEVLYIWMKKGFEKEWGDKSFFF